MTQGYIFSWAENAEGRMVHVDVVPRGLKCNCFCSNCHEPLMARHGDVREHHFAHHSEDRGANLNICYMVTLYKLAEQIIQEKKRIQAPSYYGIYKPKVLEFSEVQIDSQFEREDKQPDVIGTTPDGQQYLIEFIFQWKVQHKRDIDYQNPNCIEIDLSNQTLESIEEFLLNDVKDKRWVNCAAYFSHIEEKYANAHKEVKVKSEDECLKCRLFHSLCCAVKVSKYSCEPLIIEHGGQSYRLCKTEAFMETLDREERERLWFSRMREDVERELKEEREAFSTPLPVHPATKPKLEPNIPAAERSCFNCAYNLTWDNRNGLASCGSFISLCIPKHNEPSRGQTCQRWCDKI